MDICVVNMFVFCAAWPVVISDRLGWVLIVYEAVPCKLCREYGHVYKYHSFGRWFSGSTTVMIRVHGARYYLSFGNGYL